MEIFPPWSSVYLKFVEFPATFSPGPEPTGEELLHNRHLCKNDFLKKMRPNWRARAIMGGDASLGREEAHGP
ncbi:MAG: hypothetical protein WAN03_02675, partial [Candidatus Sulfotelmatobacter sp.]